MKTHNSHSCQLFWNSVKNCLHEIDLTIEQIVQETIDDFEKAYQQD